MSNYVYYKNPANEQVYGYDSAEESQLPYIDKAKAAGWQDVTGSWPPKPPVTDETLKTIGEATSRLQAVSYLTAAEMSQHITEESRQAITDYIHVVSNILAIAQQKFAAGEAYTAEFPAQPTAVPVTGDSLTATPFIKFVVVN